MDKVTLVRGTGKTLAAETIAREANLSLYRVELMQVVSRYVGETEKNLNQLFQEAERKNWVLFFDEADALFGERSGVAKNLDRILAEAGRRGVPVIFGVKQDTAVSEPTMKRLRRRPGSTNVAS